MSVINFMNYSLSTAAEGFVPSHAPLKNNKHLNIPFQSTQPKRGKNKSELQGLPPSSRVHACRMRRGVWSHASILSVMPNVAPDRQHTPVFLPGELHGRGAWWVTVHGVTKGWTPLNNSHFLKNKMAVWYKIKYLATVKFHNHVLLCLPKSGEST